MNEIKSLIEGHDNTFDCARNLLQAAQNSPDYQDEDGRTAACLAAAIAKHLLARGLISKVGGGDIADRFGWTANDYLATFEGAGVLRAKAFSLSMQMKVLAIVSGMRSGRDAVAPRVSRRHGEL